MQAKTAHDAVVESVMHGDSDVPPIISAAYTLGAYCIAEWAAGYKTFDELTDRIGEIQDTFHDVQKRIAHEVKRPTKN